MSKYLDNIEPNPAVQPIIPQNPTVDELGNTAQPYDFPPGPGWDHAHAANSGAITNLNELPVPRVILDALCTAGYIRERERSDREEIKHGIRRALDYVLKEHIKQSLERHILLQAQAERSWGMGPR